MDKTCSSCVFWKQFCDKDDRIDDFMGQGAGECVRYPPVLIPSYSQYEACDSDLAWACPVTLGEEWCGEWRAK